MFSLRLVIIAFVASFFSIFVLSNDIKKINTYHELDRLDVVEKYFLSADRSIKDLCGDSCDLIQIDLMNIKTPCYSSGSVACDENSFGKVEDDVMIPSEIRFPENLLEQSVDCKEKRMVFWISPKLMGMVSDLDLVTVFLNYKKLNDYCSVKAEIYL